MMYTEQSKCIKKSHTILKPVMMYKKNVTFVFSLPDFMIASKFLTSDSLVISPSPALSSPGGRGSAALRLISPIA